MRFRLIPRNEEFFDVFDKHAAFIPQAAEKLQAIFFEPENAHTAYEYLKKIEKDADKCRKDVVGKLNSSFVTPIDRDDITPLSSKLDDAVDRIEAMGLRIKLFAKHFGGRLDFFNPLRPYTEKLLQTLIKAAEQVPIAIPCIRNKDRGRIQEIYEVVHNLEHTGDQVWCGEEGALDSYLGILISGDLLGAATKEDVILGMWNEMVCHEIERTIDIVKNIIDMASSIIDKNN